jgi:hypothetical protein
MLDFASLIFQKEIPMTPNNTQHKTSRSKELFDYLLEGTNNTQTEQIVWHCAGSEIPKTGKLVFVQYWDSTKTLKYFDTDMYGHLNSWLKHEGNVIAWAEMPKGWRQE